VRVVTESVERVVVHSPAVLTLPEHVRRGNGRIAPAIDKFGLELLVNVCEVNDEDGAVRRLVGAVDVVAIEDSHAVGSEVRPELLEMLPDDVLAVARVVERDFLADATDESRVVLA